MATARKIRPKNALATPRQLDGRTWQAKHLNDARAQFRANAGGLPGPLAAMTVERAAMLSLHLAEMDQRALAAGGMGEALMRDYLAMSDALARAVEQLAGVRR